MIQVKESISLMVQNRKLNILLLQQIVSSQNLQTIIDLSHSLKTIIQDHKNEQPIQTLQNTQISQQSKQNKDQQIIKQQNIPPPQQNINNKSKYVSVKQCLFQKATQNDIIGIFNIIRILYIKLKGTVHEIIIRKTLKTLFKKLKSIHHLKNISNPHDLISLVQLSHKIDLDKEEKIRMTIKSNTLVQTIDTILNSFQSIFECYYYLERKLLPIFNENLITTKKKDRIPYLLTCCKVLLKFFPPLQLQIQISKNAFSQSRRFKQTLQLKVLKSNKNLTNVMAKLLNQMILCPSQTELQLELFTLLRRMYYLWQEPIRNPIFVVISNILIYSKTDSDLKSVSLFAYRIIKQKQDLHLSILIENSQSFKFLKQSPYYSSKAMAYLNESNCSFSTSNIKLPFWKLFAVIGSGQVKQHLIIIQKQSSLFCWQIVLKGYDIRFGLFKIQNLQKLQLSDYQSQKNCRSVVKFNKLMINKQGHNGSILLKSGIYKIVLDNSYSYIRNKQIIYNYSILEPL